MKRNLAIILLISALGAPTITNAALIPHYDAISGHNIVEDTTTGYYWFSTLGLGNSYFDIQSEINTLNNSSTFGITNWQLASPEAAFSMIYNSAGELEQHFQPTHVSYGQDIFPDPNPACGLPYMPACNDTVYSY
ncbi:MAG TPA: hypothetical protein VIQ03_13760, partial [Gammaproteobacteria bacterium]